MSASGPNPLATPKRPEVLKYATIRRERADVVAEDANGTHKPTAQDHRGRGRTEGAAKY